MEDQFRGLPWEKEVSHMAKSSEREGTAASIVFEAQGFLDGVSGQRPRSEEGAVVEVTSRETKVVSFFNHAGGAGKTSATRDLGFVLAEEGFAVLLIDADPQANLTSWLGVRQKVDLRHTLYPAVMGETASERVLPEPMEAHGLHLIPASLELARVELQLAAMPTGALRLRQAIRRIPMGIYDFVLVDCPPSLGQLSALGVIASDLMVVPVPTSVKGIEGIGTVQAAIDEWREGSAELEVAMYLLTRYDARVNHHKEAAEALHAELGHLAPIAGPIAERPAIYSEASLAGVPVPAYQPGSRASLEARSAADLLVQSLGVRVDG
jgi:chromosome partitioning protein